LLSGAADVVAVGEIDWTALNGSWRGSVACVAQGVDDCSVVLQINIRPRRPSEPTVVLLLNGEICRRVDVNGTHQHKRWTHVQGRDSSSDPDQLFPDPPDWFPVVALGPVVSPWIYHQVFNAAGRLFMIDTGGVQWVDPPSGGAR